MANRRMFSLRIVNSARFLKMPSEAQVLYFHLCMNADDDGVVEAYTILKKVGVPTDNFKVLVAKGFVVPLNEDDVAYILDWREHNLIRSDRKVDSIYKDLLVKVIPEVEVLQPQTRADRIPKDLGRPKDVNGTTMGQRRLGKVRLGNTIIEQKLDTPFNFKEEIKKLEDNPRRDLNIIALYFTQRKPEIKTKEQYSVALKRHLHDAKELAVFDDAQILKACNIAEKEYPKIWTVRTLVKILTK